MIDIIIPTYNAHDTIIRTLMSISMQTIKDKVKVYVVDDCSTISYEKEVEIFKDKLNIKLCRLNKNFGPGYARQYGLDHSKGEFIVFMDSDDMLSNAFSLETLYNNISKGYDVVCSKFYCEANNEAQNNVRCLHGKIFRRSTIDRYNFKFTSTKYHEDNSFFSLFLLSPARILYTDDIVYFNFYNPKSLTNDSPIANENYEIFSIEYFCFNMEYVIVEAEKRKFDSFEIARFLYHQIVYLYKLYNIYNNIYANRILLCSKNLVRMLKKYNRYLSEQDRIAIYCGLVCDIIPIETLDNFFMKVNLAYDE